MAYKDFHMGNCAEICAAHYDFSREAQDAYAEQSYRRAQDAAAAGRLAAEIVPVEVPQRRGEPITVDRDDEPERADFEKMRKLRPAFLRDGGTVTAANASTINDGAAALVLTTAEHAAALGRPPLARLVAQSTFAHEPEWFTTAPVTAVRQVTERAGLSVADIDLFEINEAFASVVVSWARVHEPDMNRVNVNGGAIALGHPVGATGSRLITTALHELERSDGNLALISMCCGGALATGTILERL